jgi:hypothetical protein
LLIGPEPGKPVDARCCGRPIHGAALDLGGCRRCHVASSIIIVAERSNRATSLAIAGDSPTLRVSTCAPWYLLT